MKTPAEILPIEREKLEFCKILHANYCSAVGRLPMLTQPKNLRATAESFDFLGVNNWQKKKLETIYVCECVCLSLLQFEQTHFESHRTVWLYFSSNIARIREFWTKSSGGLKCHGSLMPGLIYRFELRGEGWCAKAKGFLCRGRVRHLFES